MFERIDKEADGEVYVKEVTDFLRVLDDNLEQSDEVLETNQNDEHNKKLVLKVNELFAHYKREASKVLNFEEFTVSRLKRNHQIQLANTFKGVDGCY